MNIGEMMQNCEDYVIMKLNDRFPKIMPGKEDVDILCTSIPNFILNLKIPRKYQTRKKIINSHQVHLDLLQNKKFVFKFDLYDDLCFTKWTIHPEYKNNVLTNKISINRNNFKLWIPQLTDDLAIRYMEYLDKINIRKDKIKHLRYVEKYPNIFKRVKLGDSNFNNIY